MTPHGQTPDLSHRAGIRAGLPLLLLAALVLAGCGGGGSPSPAPQTNPLPVLNSISPTAGSTGGPAFTLTVNGSSFISGSRVRWNGADRTTTFVTSTRLTAAIPASDIAAQGTAQITVFNPTPGGGTSAPPAIFTIAPVSPVAIETSQLPPTSGGKAYDFTLAISGGIAPYNWSISAGALPGGLSIDATTGRIGGTASPVPTDTPFNITVQAADSAVTPNVGIRGLSIMVRAASLGSNDACTAGSTAGTTPISNGRIRASISPYGDVDVYSFNGTAGKQVTIEIFAQRLDLDGDTLTRDSQMDSMLELLDSSCPDPQLGGASAMGFNDDIVTGDQQDSLIRVSSDPFPAITDAGNKRPPTSLPSTGLYFIRVRDFRGDGRPDLVYELSLSGAD